MKIYVHTLLSPALQAQLASRLPDGFVVVFRNQLPEEAAQQAFREANFVMGNPPVAWWQNLPPHLQFWQIDSAGFEVYRELSVSVPVCNVGNYFGWPCAETIVAGILALYRHIDQLAVLQTQQKWIGAPLRFSMKLLHKQRVVVLGAGNIGHAVAQILGGFDCDVQLMARTHPAAQIKSTEELQAVLPQADLVINCLPGTAKGFFDASLIATMKSGSVFANVGRGSTVDEPALIAALQSGHLGGAVLDVTAVEPLPAESPFWQMSNVVLTQHTAGGTQTEDEGKIDIFLDNLRAFLNIQPLDNQIDLQRGY